MDLMAPYGESTGHGILTKAERSVVEKPTLNLGCGPDNWGDIKVDIAFRTRTCLPSLPDVIADGQQVPFGDCSFSFCRCWHVIEHVDGPRQVINEIRRVADHASIRFPTDNGVTSRFLIGLVTLDLHSITHSIRTWRTGAHKWVIIPQHGTKHYQDMLSFLHSGRKARFFRWIRPILMPWEWEINI